MFDRRTSVCPLGPSPGNGCRDRPAQTPPNPTLLSKSSASVSKLLSRFLRGKEVFRLWLSTSARNNVPRARVLLVFQGQFPYPFPLIWNFRICTFQVEGFAIFCRLLFWREISKFLIFFCICSSLEEGNCEPFRLSKNLRFVSEFM